MDYVLAVIGHHGHLYATFQHSSAGGEAFRDGLWAGSVADLIGAEAAGHLRSRSIAGLDSPELPSWGHLRAGEVAVVASEMGELDPDHPDAGELSRLSTALARAGHFGLGIASVDG